jgi:hypothetical protein
MSEPLNSLPENPNTIPSPKEQSTMSRFFKGNQMNVHRPPPSVSANDNSIDPKSWKNTMKLAFYMCIIFVLLSNPIVDGILSGISYLSSSLSVTVFKICVFIILFVALYKKFFMFS